MVEMIPVMIVLLVLAATCIIIAMRLQGRAEFGALAAILITGVVYLLFPMNAIIDVSRQIAGWISLIIFFALVWIFLLSPCAYERWGGRHGCSSGSET